MRNGGPDEFDGQIAGVRMCVCVCVSCAVDVSDGETVGKVSSAIVTTFDLPTASGGNHLTTGFFGKPSGPGGGAFPEDPAFCFLLKVRGPFDSPSNTIRVSMDGNGEWVADITDGQVARIGCERFAALSNAGNATTEGYNEYDYVVGDIIGPGVTAPIQAQVPEPEARNPSFCPLTGIIGEWNASTNCESLPTARADPFLGSDDAVLLAARGSRCLVPSPPFGIPEWVTTTVTAEAHCQTKWSGLERIRYASYDIPSGTGAGTSTGVDTSSGVCWISRVNGNLRTASEEIEIYPNNGVWYVRSTTSGAGWATCLSYEQ